MNFYRYLNLFVISIIIDCYNTIIVNAQVFSLEGLDLPPPKSISIHPYQFFVYEKKEIPIHIFASKNEKQPELIFENIKWEVSKNILLDYESIELSILPSEDLENFLKNDGIIGACCNKEDVLRGDCLNENTFAKPKIDGWISTRFKSQPINFAVPLQKGGIYTLLVSNCGDTNEGYLKGNVIVKNTYGYLPAIEYMKIALYFFGTSFYALLSIFWLYKCIVNNKQLINMQYYMGGIIVVSILDSMLWFYFFKQWNNTGIQSVSLFGLSKFVNSLKSTLIIILTLIASHGVGISVSSLKVKKKLLIFSIGSIYFVFSLLKEFVAYLKTTLSNISSSLLFASILPIGILNGLIFFWVFYELVNLINNLEDEKQTEKLFIYKRFMYILFAIIILAMCFFLVEIKLFNSSINKRWRYQWILQDAIPLLYVTLLELNLLLLWNPKENSKKYLAATEIPAGIVIELESQEIKICENTAFEDQKVEFYQKRSWDRHIDIPEDNSENESALEVSHLKFKENVKNNTLLSNTNFETNQLTNNQKESNKSKFISKSTFDKCEKENLQDVINRPIVTDSPLLKRKFEQSRETESIVKIDDEILKVNY